MLQLSCCVSLRMDVTDLFHFQATFQANGIIKSTSDEKHIPGIGLFGSKPLDPLLVVQDLLDLLRKTLKLGDKILITPLGNTSAHQRKLNGKAIAGDQLGAVGFRCGNCDLRTGKGIKYIICFPGNGASHHIDNSKGFQPLLFRKTECCKTVCSLAGLADHNHKTVGIQRHVSVTELRCQIHTYRQLRQILQHILTCHAYVIGRTTCHNIYLGKRLKLFLSKSHRRQVDGTIL